MERINNRQEEKAELEAQLAIEAKKERVVSAQEVTHFLSVLQKSNFNDPLNRRAVINIFLNKIYLYDDKFRLVLNDSGQPVEIDNIMLDEIDDYFDSQMTLKFLIRRSVRLWLRTLHQMESRLIFDEISRLLSVL